MSSEAMAKRWSVPVSVPPAVVVRAVREWLARVDVDTLGEAESLELVGLLEESKGASAALQARATARFVEARDAEVAVLRGSGELDERVARQRRSAARSEVALARRCSPSQSDRHVGLARALVHELPETMSALTRGEISEWRATLVARGTACLDPGDRREADRRLSPELVLLGDRSLDRAARRVSAELDAASVAERNRRAAASRHVSVRPAPDGMAWLTVLGPLVEVVGAKAALEAGERRRWVASGDPAVDAARAADTRGRGAWMADTALALLSGRSRGGLDLPRVQPVEVGLVMTPGTLLPRLGGVTGCPLPDVPAEVPGWGPVPGQIAREHLRRLLDDPSIPDPSSPGSGTPDLSADTGAPDTIGPDTGGRDTRGGDRGVAGPGGDETPGEREARVWLRRLFTSPDGRDLVAMDSRRRCFGGALRTLLTRRDPTCRIPWCDAPTREIDHVTRVAEGGPTSAVNAMGVCARHNHTKEAPGWSGEVTRTGLDPGGGPHTVHLTTPTGSTYDAQAPPLLGPAAGTPPGRALRSTALEHPPSGRSDPPPGSGIPPPRTESPVEAYLHELLRVA